MIKTTSAIHIAATTFFLILIVGCSSERKNLGIDDPMTNQELTKEALSLSWDLLEKGQAMANAGKSISEILKIMPDSTIVQTNAEAILYFIKGSVPMLIELPGDPNAPMTKGGGQVASSAAGNTAFASMATSLLVDGDEEVNVLAYKKGEEGREEKKALIISAYGEYFGNNDDALVANQWLKENRNYEGRIDYVSKIISLTTFDSFDEYDLVHLSTHGKRFCDPATFADGSEIEIVYGGDSNYCRTLIDTNIENPFESLQELNNVLALNPIYKDHLYFGENKIFLRSS